MKWDCLQKLINQGRFSNQTNWKDFYFNLLCSISNTNHLQCCMKNWLIEFIKKYWNCCHVAINSFFIYLIKSIIWTWIYIVVNDFLNFQFQFNFNKNRFQRSWCIWCALYMSTQTNRRYIIFKIVTIYLILSK